LFVRPSNVTIYSFDSISRQSPQDLTQWDDVEAALDAEQERKRLEEEAAQKALNEEQRLAAMVHEEARGTVIKLEEAENQAKKAYQDAQLDAWTELTAEEKLADQVHAQQQQYLEQGGFDGPERQGQVAPEDDSAPVTNSVDFIANLYKGESEAADRMLGEIKARHEEQRLKEIEEATRRAEEERIAAGKQAVIDAENKKLADARESARLVAEQEKSRALEAHDKELERQAQAFAEQKRQEEEEWQNERDSFHRGDATAAELGSWQHQQPNQQQQQQQQTPNAQHPVALHTYSAEEIERLTAENEADVKEMTAFFHSAGLGSKPGRQASVHCVLYSIFTAKKLAKVVHRGNIDLQTHLLLDADDAEDVYTALDAMGMGAMGGAMGSTPHMGMSGPMSGSNSVEGFSYGYPALQQQQRVSPSHPMYQEEFRKSHSPGPGGIMTGIAHLLVCVCVFFSSCFCSFLLLKLVAAM
jgi:hypothetical protein